MNIQTYKLLENYMSAAMTDSAHDKEHIYRVLYSALDIAQYESGVDYDVLICACLLHDIGRKDQFENPELCHAQVGAVKAYDFLIKNGFDTDFAEKVRSCILSHRYRADRQPESIEAMILFDADKVDVVGAIGIARTLFYQGKVGEPLYSVLPDGRVADGSDEDSESFFHEYKFKLEGLYSKFYTRRGGMLAAQRQAAAVSFYNSMLEEVKSSYETGAELLGRQIN